MPLAAPSAVGFDFDHTLGIDRSLEISVLGELLPGAAGAAIATSLDAYRSGTQTLEDALALCAEQTGERPFDARELAVRFRSECVARVPQFVRALPGAGALLATLREAKIPHAILTNGWSPLQERKARAIGFDGPILVSETIGASKPGAAAFEQLARALGCAPANIWYVGDDPLADVDGAIRAGMQGLWFDWEGRGYPQLIHKPCAVIHHLRDAIALLRGTRRDAAKAAE